MESAQPPHWPDGAPETLGDSGVLASQPSIQCSIHHPPDSKDSSLCGLIHKPGTTNNNPNSNPTLSFVKGIPASQGPQGSPGWGRGKSNGWD